MTESEAKEAGFIRPGARVFIFWFIPAWINIGSKEVYVTSSIWSDILNLIVPVWRYWRLMAVKDPAFPIYMPKNTVAVLNHVRFLEKKRDVAQS